MGNCPARWVGHKEEVEGRTIGDEVEVLWEPRIVADMRPSIVMPVWASLVEGK